MPGRLHLNAGWFPDRLRELRTERGWTQKQLAERAGFSEDTIAQWERRKREPSWSSVLALCRALGVEVRAFAVRPTKRTTPRSGRPRKEA